MHSIRLEMERKSLQHHNRSIVCVHRLQMAYLFTQMLLQPIIQNGMETF